MKKITLNCSLLNEIKYIQKKESFNEELFADVWIINMQSELKNANRYYSFLNSKEIEKVNRFYHKQDKDRYIISRGILKLILSKYINSQPEEVIIESNENGKPFIYDYKNYITHFNLSHSSNSILIAVSSLPVGADVEQIVHDFQYDDILKRCFSEEEKKWIEKSKNSLNDFYLLWTRKEAIVKATSQGIDDRISFVRCLPGINKISSEYVSSNFSWNIVSLFNDNSIFSIACAKEIIPSFYNSLPIDTN